MKWNKLKKKKGVGQNVGHVQQAEQELPVERDGQAHSYEPVVRGLQEQVRRKRQRRSESSLSKGHSSGELVQ